MTLEKIRQALSTKIEPNPFIPAKSKPAAVLVVIFGSLPKLLMTKKSTRLKLHAGEISFPGGKKSKFDTDLIETSLRETREEINLGIRRDQIIGNLDPVTTLNSGFTIVPYVSVVNRLPRLKDNVEVEKILHIPIIPLLHTLQKDKDPEHQKIEEMYIFNFQDHIVWGASARILKQIHNIFSKRNMI